MRSFVTASQLNPYFKGKWPFIFFAFLALLTSLRSCTNEFGTDDIGPNVTYGFPEPYFISGEGFNILSLLFNTLFVIGAALGYKRFQKTTFYKTRKAAMQSGEQASFILLILSTLPIMILGAGMIWIFAYFPIAFLSSKMLESTVPLFTLNMPLSHYVGKTIMLIVFSLYTLLLYGIVFIIFSRVKKGSR